MTIPPSDTVKKATAIIQAYLENSLTWPEDHWLVLSDEWELNMWADHENIYATLYETNNDRTITTEWHPLFVKSRSQEEE